MIVTALVIAVLLVWADAGQHLEYHWAAVLLIGGAVGWIELLGRYRYAPVRATMTLSAWGYVAVNVIAAGIAYYLLPLFYTDLAHPTTEKEQVERVLIAGFGALVFLRSSLFKFRVGDADIGVGPAALLDTLLLVADRGVDRREAVSRAQDVSGLMAQVNNPRLVAKMLTRYCLALMQNVDQPTQDSIKKEIDKIVDEGEIPDQIVLDLVALRLGVVVGPDVLEAAVTALGDRLSQLAGKPTAPAGGTQAAAASPQYRSEDFKSELTGAGVAAPISNPQEPPA